MENALRYIEYDDFLFVRDNGYHEQEEAEYKKAFDELVLKGKIKSRYEDTYWKCFSGVKGTELSFQLNEIHYLEHGYKLIGMEYHQLVDMMKKYAILQCGVFIFSSIASRINTIMTFLANVGKDVFYANSAEKSTILEFLTFCNVPESVAEIVAAEIVVKRIKPAQQRELAHLSTYLAIADEIETLYDSGLPDDEFIRWFPIRFWCAIDFIMPHRATEMLVTPFDCISRRTDGTFLRIRRTLLKGRKGKKKRVYYDLENDYEICEYQVPDLKVFSDIEKYQQLTSGQQRGTLFVYGVGATNHIFSLSSFNQLLTVFMDQYIIGNAKFDFVRFAAGIQEFGYVTAGDARPIAMANLYYQDFGGDICRQLAGHVNLNTSAHYYTNIANTIEASSIIQVQKLINNGRFDDKYAVNDHVLSEKTCSDDDEYCTSPRHPRKTGNIEDCLANRCISDCVGCRFFEPPKEYLDAEMQKRQDKLDEASKALLDCISGNTIKAKVEDLDYLYLGAHTALTRYGIACNVKTKETAIRWQRQQSTVTSY